MALLLPEPPPVFLQRHRQRAKFSDYRTSQLLQANLKSAHAITSKSSRGEERRVGLRGIEVWGQKQCRLASNNKQGQHAAPCIIAAYRERTGWKGNLCRYRQRKSLVILASLWWYVNLTFPVLVSTEPAPSASMDPDVHVPTVSWQQFWAAANASAPHAAVHPPGLLPARPV